MINHVICIIRCFLFFDQEKGKIAARYQQAFGTKSMQKRISQRSIDGDGEGGIVWHTTG